MRPVRSPSPAPRAGDSHRSSRSRSRDRELKRSRSHSWSHALSPGRHAVPPGGLALPPPLPSAFGRHALSPGRHVEYRPPGGYRPSGTHRQPASRVTPDADRGPRTAESDLARASRWGPPVAGVGFARGHTGRAPSRDESKSYHWCAVATSVTPALAIETHARTFVDTGLPTVICATPTSRRTVACMTFTTTLPTK